MLDIAEIDKKRYLVYELCNGGDLRKYMNHFGNFDEELIRIIVVKLLNGLSELKRKEVIHHDIKPENILIQLYPDEKELTPEYEKKIFFIKENTQKKKKALVKTKIPQEIIKLQIMILLIIIQIITLIINKNSIWLDLLIILIITI